MDSAPLLLLFPGKPLGDARGDELVEVLGGVFGHELVLVADGLAQALVADAQDAPELGALLGGAVEGAVDPVAVLADEQVVRRKLVGAVLVGVLVPEDGVHEHGDGHVVPVAKKRLDEPELAALLVVVGEVGHDGAAYVREGLGPVAVEAAHARPVARERVEREEQALLAGVGGSSGGVHLVLLDARQRRHARVPGAHPLLEVGDGLDEGLVHIRGEELLVEVVVDGVVPQPASGISPQLGIGALVGVPEMLDGIEALLGQRKPLAWPADGLERDADAAKQLIEMDEGVGERRGLLALAFVAHVGPPAEVGA